MAGTSLSWPIPEQHVEIVGNKVILESAVVGVLHLVAALWLLWSSRGVLTVLRYASDLPGQAILSVLAMLATWGLVVFGLAKTGHLLLQTRPLGRPLAIMWAVLAFAIATADGSPGYLYVVALVMGVGAAALHLSPWARAEFARAEERETIPTPIAFSLTMIAVLFGVSAAYGVALLPLLGQIETMNAMGEFLGTGAVGTKFVFGLLALIVACVLGFTAFKKIRSRNVGGRMLVTVLAVVSTISMWLTISAATDTVGGFGGGGDLGMVKVAGLVVWGAILLPLWLGGVPATWFNTTAIGGFSKAAPSSSTTGDTA